MYYLWHDDHTPPAESHQGSESRRARGCCSTFQPTRQRLTYLALDSHPNISLRLFNPSKARGNRLLRWFEQCPAASS